MSYVKHMGLVFSMNLPHTHTKKKTRNTKFETIDIAISRINGPLLRLKMMVSPQTCGFTQQDVGGKWDHMENNMISGRV